MQGRNARNARVESESILVSCCIASNVNAQEMQHNKRSNNVMINYSENKRFITNKYGISYFIIYLDFERRMARAQVILYKMVINKIS